jgi:hypothetical protein
MREEEGLKSEKGVQHMRQDAYEQPKIQESKGPSKVIYPLSYDAITFPIMKVTF